MTLSLSGPKLAKKIPIIRGTLFRKQMRFFGQGNDTQGKYILSPIINTNKNMNCHQNYNHVLPICNLFSGSLIIVFYIFCINDQLTINPPTKFGGFVG